MPSSFSPITSGQLRASSYASWHDSSGNALQAIKGHVEQPMSAAMPQLITLLTDIATTTIIYIQSAHPAKRLPSVQTEIKTDLARLADGLEERMCSAGGRPAETREVVREMLKGEAGLLASQAGRQIMLRALLQQEALRVIELAAAALVQVVQREEQACGDEDGKEATHPMASRLVHW